jgi:hypothetical protein
MQFAPMHRLALGAALVTSLSLIGCKSDFEKLADEVCACSDQKCLDEVQKKWKDKVPDTKLGEIDKLPEKDKAAVEKMAKCAFDIAKK